MATCRTSCHIWTPEAVGALAWAIGSGSYLAILMASTSTPNRADWQGVALAMGCHDVHRVSQLRGKWKVIKVAFRTELVYHKWHGTPSLEPPFSHMYWLWEPPAHR